MKSFLIECAEINYFTIEVDAQNENEAREFSNNAGFAQEFQRLLFSRVVPNLSRIGLLTDKVRPLYDKLGVLEFESHSSEDISWAELEKPLDQSA